RRLSTRTDGAVLRTFAGPEELRPTAEQVAKPTKPYRLTIREYWRYLKIVRRHKGLMTFRLSPDKEYLDVDVREYDDPNDADPDVWRRYFERFLGNSPVEHVQISGHLRAEELTPFLAIPTLKRLSIHGAHIDGDPAPVLSGARQDLLID